MGCCGDGWHWQAQKGTSHSDGPHVGNGDSGGEGGWGSQVGDRAELLGVITWGNRTEGEGGGAGGRQLQESECHNCSFGAHRCAKRKV